MAEKKQIGLFWGKDSLNCIEIAGTTINQLFSIPIADSMNFGTGQNPGAGGQGAGLSSLIKDSFKQYGISTNNINLSLPVRDIIFRTFIIPWMQAGEVKGVVEFEARKYIPFALEELNFAYHSTNIIQDGARKIRIIFIAIKKETLETYTSVFEEIGINVVKIEPAPFSLIRALTFKEVLPQDQDIAIIEKSSDSGKIVIVDKGIPQFVREFQLRLPVAHKDGTVDQGMLMTRLVNDIRVSLDYFNRQNTQFTVEQILLISLKEGQEFGKKLEEDLRMQVSAVDCQSIFDNVAVDTTGYLNALGVSLAGVVSSPINMDLVSKKSKRTRSARPSFGNNVNYKSVVLIFLLCAGVLAGSLLLGGNNSSGVKSEIAKLQSELGEFKDTTVVKLKDENKVFVEKTNYYSSIPTGSEIAYFLVHLTKLLPEGVWVNKINFSYVRGYGGSQSAADTKVATQNKKSKKGSKESKVEKKTQEKEEDVVNKFGLKIDFGGYAYVPNANEQFRLINDLLVKIKDHNDFKRYFKNIELKTVKSQPLGDFNVTYYEIRCQ